jgi:hypothetical protein
MAVSFIGGEKEQYPQKSTDLWKVPGNLYYKYTTDYKWRSIHRNPLICTRHWQYITNTVKPAHVVTSIKQSPVLKGHICLVRS